MNSNVVDVCAWCRHTSGPFLSMDARMESIQKHMAECKEHPARKLADLHQPRPLSEWHEDIGPVLWWKFPINEPPYVGTPNDYGYVVQMHAYPNKVIGRGHVGGWPGYHTHWTPLPDPRWIQEAAASLPVESNKEDSEDGK